MSRVITSIGVVAIISGCVPTPEQALQWTTYRSVQGGFEVAVPESHSEYANRRRHAFGNLMEHTVYWRSPALCIENLGLKLVSAGYYEISTIDPRLNADFVLDSFAREESRLGGTTRTGRVVELSKDSIQGYPSRRICSVVDVGKSDSLYLLEQFVLRKNRMYHLRLNGYKSVLDTNTMQIVKRSFRLLPA